MARANKRAKKEQKTNKAGSTDATDPAEPTLNDRIAYLSDEEEEVAAKGKSSSSVPNGAGMEEEESEDEEGHQPFSFFGADVSSSEDEKEDDKPSGTETKVVQEVRQPKVALPKVSQLLSDKSLANPAFLTTNVIYQEQEITTFDKRSHAPPKKPWEGKKKIEMRDFSSSSKGPPEGHVATGAAAAAMAAAQAMSKSYENPDPGEIVAINTANTPISELNKSKVKRKKDDIMSFAQREKRKRDMGQSSRGKSYVEEEKRLLRQHDATANSSGQGFD